MFDKISKSYPFDVHAQRMISDKSRPKYQIINYRYLYGANEWNWRQQSMSWLRSRQTQTMQQDPFAPCFHFPFISAMVNFIASILSIYTTTSDKMTYGYISAMYLQRRKTPMTQYHICKAKSENGHKDLTLSPTYYIQYRIWSHRCFFLRYKYMALAAMYLFSRYVLVRGMFYTWKTFQNALDFQFDVE